MSQLAFYKPNDGDQWNFHPFSRWGDARQHPIHSDAMREFEDHFVYQLILADCSRDWRHFRVGRHLRNESFRLELAQFVAADAPGQHWNVIYISVLDHCGERVLRVARRELILHMPFPKLA